MGKLKEYDLNQEYSWSLVSYRDYKLAYGRYLTIGTMLKFFAFILAYFSTYWLALDKAGKNGWGLWSE